MNLNRYINFGIFLGFVGIVVGVIVYSFSVAVNSWHG
jgi:predicted PurR-regulated permease PerM